jgi:hypothetical protein
MIAFIRAIFFKPNFFYKIIVIPSQNFLERNLQRGQVAWNLISNFSLVWSGISHYQTNL